ncbi:MAG: alanine racemase [Betaproteobacteria bacterium]|nr:alanine racemase [Betaproteobacteria bacterium]
MPRPIRATIDLAAFRHNYALAKRHAGQARAWAVIKANAYGHGLLQCAEAIRDIADGYAMLDLADAALLRKAGLTQPILLLEGAFEAADVSEAARLNLGLAVHQPEQIRMLELARPPAPLDLFLKLNTGMNRLGFRPAEARHLVERLRNTGAARSITLMTHFACADEEAGIADALARFDSGAAGLALPHCVANSAALLRFPAAARESVRPGIMLYGASPMPAMMSAEVLDLRPVMQLESRIIGVQELALGAAVGYGARFVAQQPMRIGVVACGYADGYPRHAPTGTPILIDGVRTRTLGRVSMDMLACDLTGLPQANVGSQAVLWGKGLPADEVAAAAETISYELFCALAGRVPVAWSF